MTLLSALCANGDSRLVLQSSEMHRVQVGSAEFRDLAKRETDAGPTVPYD